MTKAGRVISHDALRDEMMAVARGGQSAPAEARQQTFNSDKAGPLHPGSFVRAEIIQGRSLTVS